MRFSRRPLVPRRERHPANRSAHVEMGQTLPDGFYACRADVRCCSKSDHSRRECEITRRVSSGLQTMSASCSLSPQQRRKSTLRHFAFVPMHNSGLTHRSKIRRKLCGVFNPLVNFIAERRKVDRLGQKRLSAVLERLTFRLCVSVGCDHDDWNVGAGGLKLGQ